MLLFSFKKAQTTSGLPAHIIQARSRLPWNKRQNDMKRMLIVDDNTEFLETLSTVLSSDFDTITATGVKDAWNILQAITVDAICSDFNMKAGTGLDLLEDIRQKGISVPFLLMSSNDDSLLETQTKFYGGVFCCKTDCDLIAKIKALNKSIFFM
ncbi:response regulator [Varibaculum vaginae]|uniref:response regulator n=1 Tax=Varibaculum vaginae TaxID=2364797 RepID=UPI00190F638A|nr:response regulator [Varibaculum vaginae]